MNGHTQEYSPTELFSRRIERWEPGAIRNLLPLESQVGLLSLVAGKPNPVTFPFSEISISLHESEEKIILEKDELEQALQYNLPGGCRELVEWFEKLQILVHSLHASPSWTCCIGNGSQELLHKTLQVFTDPGDPVLVETPAYAGILGMLRADRHQIVGVATDQDGIIPTDLERLLSDWPTDTRRPSVIYTVPTGSNPCGSCCPTSRKSQILKLAKRFKFVILEDDAYFYLDYRDATQRHPSYLELEREVNGDVGRVVRFDSLSKIVSAGMRVGVLTGPLEVVQKVIRVTENTSLQPSTMTQALATRLLRHWGQAGFLAHCAKVAHFYKQRRDAFIAAMDRNLTGKATWTSPAAGMFVWAKLCVPSEFDSFDIMTHLAQPYGILAVPGVEFMPDKAKSTNLRLSFTLISEDKMDEACSRIAKLVEACWGG